MRPFAWFGVKGDAIARVEGDSFRKTHQPQKIEIPAMAHHQHGEVFFNPPHFLAARQSPENGAQTKKP